MSSAPTGSLSDWMMSGVIEDDRSSRDVIDLVMRGCDGFVAVT